MTYSELWERVRRDGIARMVANEPGTIWADKHRLLTCGSHTGHMVQAIALCDDDVWAEAIAAAIAKAIPTPATRDRGEA